MIEPARAADLPAMAALHADSWRRFYADDVPAEALGPRLDAMMAQKWTHERLDRMICLVARRGGDVVGLVAADPAHPRGPLLDNLHVAAAHHRSGIGRALMQRVAADLQAQGHDSLWLTVLTGNARARAAYRAYGGQEGPPEPYELLGTVVTVQTVVWPDLGVLAGGVRIAAP